MFIPHLKYFGSSLKYIPLGDGLSFMNVCDILKSHYGAVVIMKQGS